MRYIIVLPLLLLLVGCTTEPMLKENLSTSKNSPNQQNVSESFLNDMFTMSYKEEIVTPKEELTESTNPNMITIYQYVEDPNKKNGFDYVANVTILVHEYNSPAVLEKDPDFQEQYYLIVSENNNKNIIDNSGYWISENHAIEIRENLLSKNGLSGVGSSALIGTQIMPLLNYLLSEYPSGIKLDKEYPNMDSFVLNQLDKSKYVYSGYIQSETIRNNSIMQIIYYALDNYTNIPGRNLPIIVSLTITPSSDYANEQLNKDYRTLKGNMETIDNKQVYFFDEDNAFFWRKENIIFDISPAYVIPQASNFIPVDDPEYGETKEKWDYLRNRDKELMLPIVEMYLNKYSPSND